MKAYVPTRRDAQLIDWLTRYAYATTPILCTRFGVAYDTMRWRVSRLVTLGLLREERSHQPRIVVPTLAGTDLIGSPLAPPSFSIVRARHTLGVAALGAAAERDGLRAWPEREIRVADRGRKLPTLSVHLARSTPQRAPVWHLPDLVIWRPTGTQRPELEAVELELTRKTDARLKAIIQAYAASPLFTRVTYYTRYRRIALAVEETAFSLSTHARNLVQVRPLPGADYAPVDDSVLGPRMFDAAAVQWNPEAWDPA